MKIDKLVISFFGTRPGEREFVELHGAEINDYPTSVGDCFFVAITERQWLQKPLLARFGWMMAEDGKMETVLPVSVVSQPDWLRKSDWSARGR